MLVVGMEWAVGVGNADVGDGVVNGNVGQVDDLHDLYCAMVLDEKAMVGKESVAGSVEE